jgi:cytochrome P450
MLMMLLHPSVQRKAHEEIDRVIPRGTLPTLEEKDALPYITSIVLEVLRCWPVAPFGENRALYYYPELTLDIQTGVPHCTTEEDVYQGYRIPANSLVLPNLWAIQRDKVPFWLLLFQHN